MVFGRLPNYAAEATASKDIRIMDLATKSVSILAESTGMFSPRWSPDGRYLLRGKMTLYCTLANFSLDLDPPHMPVIVEVKTGKTKTLANARCRYEELQGWIAYAGVTR